MSVFSPKQRHSLGGQIAIALYRISEAIHYLFKERGKMRRLSPTQIQSLLFLKYVRPVARTIGGLADRLGASYATSSEVVDALERKGLVERSPLPEDHRVVTLRLTPKGRVETEMVENILDEIESAVNALPEEEQRSLVHALQSVVRHLQRRGFINIYDICWGCQFFQKNAHPDDPRGPHHCAFMDSPLAEPDTYWECPDFVPTEELDQEERG
ncbi:MarR family winged helix-turn-helix transcriptional regulator [Thermogutta sp.]|jgi:DNA-binding MarR family transcriptional regulator|uniref:MarR family winged helix-turn-helix transcriptional regulator n=1 Tax=Thermogutta sp. TaxID=1962930 RepID=UPI003C7DCD0F